ncbi:MAG: hypothetical protein AAGE01_24480 [Pseudomonadota bacterium]
MNEGVLTSRQVAIDTTRIRICADGEIDFPDRDFSLLAAPTPKRAEFFSLATPIAVRGTFEGIKVGTKAGLLSIGETAVRFVISPVTTPLNRLFRGTLPADGADVCELAIGPHPEELEELPGC